jgi:hypothetical protein
MSYESMRLLQLMLSLLLVLGAFLLGLLVGWRRWGRPRAADRSIPEVSAPLPPTGAAPRVYPVPVRPDLFAPELVHDEEIDLTDQRVLPIVWSPREDPMPKTADPPTELKW